MLDTLFLKSRIDFSVSKLIIESALVIELSTVVTTHRRYSELIFLHILCILRYFAVFLKCRISFSVLYFRA